MLVGGDFNDENPLKGLSTAPLIIDRGEEEYLGRRGGPEGGRASKMITPLKQLISFPMLQKNCPMNDRLVSFVLAMLNIEF